MPQPNDECPVCPHLIQYHDGIGCTSEQQGNEGLICPCPLAQDMPGSPLTAGVHARRHQTED